MLITGETDIKIKYNMDNQTIERTFENLNKNILNLSRTVNDLMTRVKELEAKKTRTTKRS